MYCYRAYHLNIHSEILLSGMSSFCQSPDVTVRVGSVSTSSNKKQRSERFFLGELEGVGRFEITDGSSIIVDPLEGVSHEMIAPNLLGGVMSVILRQRGYLVLHASSVSIGKGARNEAISGSVAFLGGSGWGKSTLAAALQVEGRSILTDDVMALQLEDTLPKVIPSFPQGKLAPAAAAALGKDPATLAPLFAHSYKRAYGFDEGFQTEPLPLKKLYILAKGEAHSIAPVSPREAFAHLVKHSRAVPALNSPKLLKRHFDQCTRLLEKVPCYRFIRKPGLAELPDLMRMVMNHADDDPTANHNQPPLPSLLCNSAKS